MSSTSSSADYGIDAPYVIRNLLIGGGLALILFLLGITGIWSGRVGPLRFGIIGFLWMAVGLIATGFWMWWSSRYGKVREREKLLSLITWRGDEQVLDVGCGRGLLLVGAAKRLTTGTATGIDVWQSEDLSGNKPEATIENAKLSAKVAEIEVRFEAIIAAVTRNKAGDVIAGSMSDAVPTKDLWTFQRDLKSRDPNWRLVETDEAA